jgi:DEAD/DEAH box helicase domain-containing protein
VFLVGQNSPVDQYLMAHSDYIFQQNPEQAVVDPDNPHIAVGHIKCAVHELPLAGSDAEMFGPYAPVILELLEEDLFVRHIDNHWYWAQTEYPSAGVNLRNIAGPVYTIQDETEGGRVIGTLDEISALSQLHNHAVYLHGAETYFVNSLDIDQKIAHVEKRDLDYYTQSIQASQIRIDEKEEEIERAGSVYGFGDVTVTTSIPMFKKIKFHSRDSLGFEKLELPPQSLETVALWFAPPAELVDEMLGGARKRQLHITGDST